MRGNNDRGGARTTSRKTSQLNTPQGEYPYRSVELRDAEGSAKVTNVRVISHVPVSEYLRRSGADRVLVPLVAANSVDPDGNPTSPKDAAQRMLEVLRDARTTDGRTEPVGVILSVDVEPVGLRGKDVMLRWSLWQAAGEHRLQGDWLNNNLAYRLRATTNRDTTSVDLWVPLPPAHGPYVVRIDLDSSRHRLASHHSPPFD